MEGEYSGSPPVLNLFYGSKNCHNMIDRNYTIDHELELAATGLAKLLLGSAASYRKLKSNSCEAAACSSER